MQEIDKSKAPTLRRVLLFSIIALFVTIGGIFIFQYRQYSDVEKRLSEAYRTQKTGITPLNNLFSTFSEAENTFRLYTLDFSEDVYEEYVGKLDTIKQYIDSLAALPIADQTLDYQLLKVEDRQKIALEFAVLKKRMDDLMFHTSDSLKQLNIPIPKPIRSSQALDSVLYSSMTDTTSKTLTDTIVREKEGLLKRIFNAKADTIIVNKENQHVEQQQVSVIRQHVASERRDAESLYRTNMGTMYNTFVQLRQKERQLVATNFDLLHGLKESMGHIRSLEISSLRKSEEQDFAIYRKNAGLFGLQLIFALSLMFVMLLALIYYQIYASSNERRLHQEKDYAAKLAEEKTSILAGISHEIRTPLHSLIGIVDLLKNRVKLEGGDEKLIDSAYYSINNINSNIADILSLSKLEASNKGEIVLDFFSPTQTFQNIVALHRNQAELKNLAIETDIAINPQTQILSSEFRIKQIASNFLSNAIKYSHKGTIVFRASIENQGSGLSLHVEVEDSGMGIREEDRPHVFRKYYTVHSNNKVGGVGLGLYISKVMAEELDGKINFHSQRGKGTTFFVDIPFAETTTVTDEKQDMRLSDLPSNLQILIVDDHPINILYMKQFFRNFSGLHTVNSGMEALSVLEQHPFDLVITDINMPDMGGEQLLQHIRLQENFQRLKVLAISADMGTLTPPAGDGQRATFDGYIEKPFTEAELVKVLLNALDLDSKQASIHP